MADEHPPTVRIRRPARVKTDERGRTVRVDTVTTAQLELVSTGELKQLLASDDEATQTAIQRAVKSKQEGVLARDPATGLFEIINEADLRALLDEENAPMTTRPGHVTLEAVGGTDTAADLSLVSTQALRKVLQKDRAGTSARPAARPARGPVVKKDKGGGFDPYNTG